MRTCKDCGIIYIMSEAHSKEHEGLCCDCFDQSFGMSDRHRRIKRPAQGEFVCVIRTPDPDQSNHVGKGSSPEEAIGNARNSVRAHFTLIRELI